MFGRDLSAGESRSVQLRRSVDTFVEALQQTSRGDAKGFANPSASGRKQKNFGR